ncbi:peroxidase-like [Argiope bruennichi]|uniref:peroxidase-like n=1 Tax=Argiope bruennichi TaxID=94029 RepID=UPI002494E9AD|nr:peroxidase-like [Argiope bruennichi]
MSRTITLMKWASIFILSTTLVPVLISADSTVPFARVFKFVKINFYSLPSENEQPANNTEVRDSESLNMTINNIDEPWNFEASIPEDPHHCRNEQILPCDPSYPYRSIDGSCNNLIHPTWGIPDECYMRLQPAYYEGYDGVRKSKNGDPLPCARDLTLNVFKEGYRPSPNVSFMFTIYGQTVAHDLSHSENVNLLEPCCKDGPPHESCMALTFRSNDSFFSTYNITCQDMHRTEACEICNTTNREQVNAVTAALDASLVYEKKNKKLMELRANDGTGKMLVSITEIGELLPPHKGPYDTFCRKKKKLACFLTGDLRGNQHFFLTGIVTIFVREHNRIATNLKKMNPHWEEERLFQESRRINIALLQCITYKEYLQVLLGPYIMDRFNLTVKYGSEGSTYYPRIRLGVSNEWSTAAFRLHSMIPQKADARGTRFKDFFLKPEFIREGHLESIIKDSFIIPSEGFDHYYAEDLSKHMFQRPNIPYGLDIPSLDIQRGRDHGIPPYLVMVRFCSKGRVKIVTFDDLAPLLMTKEKAEILKENYGSVEDIDLFVGIQMENFFPEAAVGPTTACIIAMQFYSNKFGDRFFFEHVGLLPSFTAAQRNSLKQCSLSRLFCDNSNITHVQKNLMLLPSITNPEVPCEDIPEVDLSLWAESPSHENNNSLNA